MPEIVVRDERPGDRAAVRLVNELAFGRPNEADLVEMLHGAGAAVVALVGEREGEVAGHILFSPVTVEDGGSKRLLGLAPMAVTPALQRQGIGGLLIRKGLLRCEEAGYDGVVVVGHPGYYARFGFAPAQRFWLRCEYGVPSEAFMALALTNRSIAGAGGLVRYHSAFSTV